MRIFGFPVRVRGGFLIVVAALGAVGASMDRAGLIGIAVWTALVTVSVLWHELGHAVLMRRFGFQPEIELTAMGGLTHWRGEGATPGQRLLVSLAGPGAGLLLGGALWVVSLGAPPSWQATLELSLWLNVGWSLVNLIPMVPWDGGGVLSAICDMATNGRGARITAGISMAIALLCFGIASRLAMIWCVYLAMVSMMSARDLWRSGPPPKRRFMLVPSIAVSVLLQGVPRPDLAEAAELTEEDAEDEPDLAWQAELFEDAAWRYLFAGRVDAARRIEGRFEAPPVLQAMIALQGNDPQRALEHLPPDSGEIDPGDMDSWAQIVGCARVDDARYADALALFEECDLQQSTHHIVCARMFYAGAFDQAAALAMREFNLFSGGKAAFNAACSHARAGRIEVGVEWLERAADVGFSDLEAMDTDTDLDGLRAHPRFSDLRDRVEAAALSRASAGPSPRSRR